VRKAIACTIFFISIKHVSEGRKSADDGQEQGDLQSLTLMF
jgi:hypothetical protein